MTRRESIAPVAKNPEAENCETSPTWVCPRGETRLYGIAGAKSIRIWLAAYQCRAHALEELTAIELGQPTGRKVLPGADQEVQSTVAGVPKSITSTSVCLRRVPKLESSDRRLQTDVQTGGGGGRQSSTKGEQSLGAEGAHGIHEDGHVEVWSPLLRMKP